ncbi:hypothetical protein BH09BAC5_BH09BAC5_05630 [soil metagenome]
MKTITIRIKEAIDNEEANIQLLASMSDRALEIKLDAAYQQTVIAEKNRNTSSLELLDVWIHQIIQARIYKAEQNIPDAPNEIELAIADIETVVVQTKERVELLDAPSVIPKKQRRTIIESDEDHFTLF